MLLSFLVPLSSNVYSSPNYVVDGSDFMCGIYVHMHPKYMPVKDIAITCKADVAVGSVIAHIYTTVKSIYPYRIREMLPMLAMQ